MDVSRRQTLAALTGATATTLVAATPAAFAASTGASGRPGTRVPGASLRGPSIDLLTPEGNLLTTWQLELPMRNQHDVVPLQVKLQREESGAEKRKEQKEVLWRIDLAFDLAPLGPLQVQAQLLRGSLSSQLWAERAETALLIDQELDNLRQRLLGAGLEVGELSCRQGMPPQGPKTHLEQRWVDETA